MLRYASQGGGEPIQLCNREALQDKCPKLPKLPTPKLQDFSRGLGERSARSRSSLKKVLNAPEAQLAWSIAVPDRSDRTRSALTKELVYT